MVAWSSSGGGGHVGGIRACGGESWFQRAAARGGACCSCNFSAYGHCPKKLPVGLESSLHHKGVRCPGKQVTNRLALPVLKCHARRRSQASLCALQWRMHRFKAASNSQLKKFDVKRFDVPRDWNLERGIDRALRRPAWRNFTRRRGSDRST